MWRALLAAACCVDQAVKYCRGVRRAGATRVVGQPPRPMTSLKCYCLPGLAGIGYGAGVTAGAATLNLIPYHTGEHCMHEHCMRACPCPAIPEPWQRLLCACGAVLIRVLQAGGYLLKSLCACSMPRCRPILFSFFICSPLVRPLGACGPSAPSTGNYACLVGAAGALRRVSNSF